MRCCKKKFTFAISSPDEFLFYFALLSDAILLVSYKTLRECAALRGLGSVRQSEHWVKTWLSGSALVSINEVKLLYAGPG